MNPGKITCEVLKKIRSEIAEANQIDYRSEPCSFKGECIGTCPKCESELQYLEHQLIKKQGSQKTALFAGVSLAIMSGFSACKNSTEPTLPVTNKHINALQSSISDSIQKENIETEAYKSKKSTNPVLKIYKNKTLIFEEMDYIVDFLSDTLQLDQISFQGTEVVRSPMQGAIGVRYETEKIICFKQARYFNNGQNLKEYLNQNFKFVGDSIQDELSLKVIVFINEYGKVNYVNVEEIQREDIQYQIKDLLLKMPYWSPAIDFKGNKVNSELLIQLIISSDKIKVKIKKHRCYKLKF
jgi:periplasmic protein TonB